MFSSSRVRDCRGFRRCQSAPGGALTAMFNMVVHKMSPQEIWQFKFNSLVFSYAERFPNKHLRCVISSLFVYGQWTCAVIRMKGINCMFYMIYCTLRGFSKPCYSHTHTHKHTHARGCVHAWPLHLQGTCQTSPMFLVESDPI